MADTVWSQTGGLFDWFLHVTVCDFPYFHFYYVTFVGHFLSNPPKKTVLALCLHPYGTDLSGLTVSMILDCILLSLRLTVSTCSLCRPSLSQCLWCLYGRLILSNRNDQPKFGLLLMEHFNVVIVAKMTPATFEAIFACRVGLFLICVSPPMDGAGQTFDFAHIAGMPNYRFNYWECQKIPFPAYNMIV